MHKVNDFVIYKNNVCVVKEIKEKFFKDKDYYILNPIDDDTLKINIPVENSLNLIRDIMTKEEALKLIDNMGNIDIIDNVDKNIENEYKRLLSTDNKEDIIKIIKTTYIRNKRRVDEGKKMGEKDEDYFKKAEKILYNELSLSLKMSFDEVKEYIIKKLSKKDI